MKNLFKNLIFGSILLFIGVALMLSVTQCNQPHDGKDGFFENYGDVSLKEIEENYETIEIEGCEYIVFTYQRGYAGYAVMAHKGNCKNPIHQH